MAEIFNEQRVLGIRLVADGTTMFNNQPVIGVREAADGVTFVSNERVLGVDVIEDGSLIHNDQPVIGAAMIRDSRDIYNNSPVVTSSGIGEWWLSFDAAIAELQANSGVMFLPLPGYMFSDVAGTVPATVGGKVARLNCVAGSGKVATQSNSASMPVLRQDAVGGPYYLDPNGANCYLITDCTGSGIDTVSMIGHGSTSGSARIFAGCYKAPDSRSYFGVADGVSDGLIGAGMDGVSWAALHDTTGWTTSKVVTVTRNPTQGKLYVDGALVDTETISGVGSELMAYLMAGNGDGVAFDFWAGPWYGLAGSFLTLSDASREVVETFFAANLAK